MEICKLCLKEKKLVNSHIIPKFMYKGMKEAESVFYQTIYDLKSKDQRTKKIQTGPFDKNILCEDCDNRIFGSTYESYAEKSMYGENLDASIAPKCIHNKDPKYGIEYSICSNIHYQKMKLFLLSILWRASITSHQAFKDVQLGTKHEERIRSILLTGEIIDEHEYPILILTHLRTKNELKNFIAQPKRVVSDDKLNAYIFLMNGVEFIFYVNSRDVRVPRYLSETTLKQNGEMVLIHLPNGSAENFIKRILKI